MLERSYYNAVTIRSAIMTRTAAFLLVVLLNKFLFVISLRVLDEMATSIEVPD